MIGIDNKFIDENEFEFAELHEDYNNEMEAWNAIKNNSDLLSILMKKKEIFNMITKILIK